MIIHGNCIATVQVGDCLDSLRTMPDRCVQMCVTSPPYFGLRDYGHDGQIGLEQTPDDYVAKLVEVFREVRRVLRDDGTLWLNLGDSYAGSWGARGRGEGTNASRPDLENKHGTTAPARYGFIEQGVKPKDLIGIPWMVAFALRADGWYLRQGIVWHKPNPMPESVTDRFTKAHEDIFLLSKSARYYFDHEAVKEPAVGGLTGRAATFDRRGNAVSEHVLPGQSAAQHRARPSKKRGEFNAKPGTPEGREPFRAVVEMRHRRSVWSIATRPYKGAHFATFPPHLVEPCVLAGSAPGDVVLDPFGGSGTTAGVALKHGRHATLLELNPEYAALIPERIRNVANAA